MTRDNTRSRIWLVLTFGDDRQYAGNTGYQDDPGRWYSYDSFVANHLQVKAGDCAIICSRSRALGVSRIETIQSEPSTRLMQRCPVCKKTGIKRRSNKQPTYRCNQGHEFELPVQETIGCTKYVAQFGNTFRAFTEQFGREFLRRGCPRYSDQLAMQEFELSRIEEEFRAAYPLAARDIRILFVNLHLLPSTADETLPDSEGYVPGQSDERQRVLRQIRERRGQQAFRDTLRERYGDKCNISRCGVLDVLEAAHITPYRGPSDNHPENGLLLRADLHTLFDLDLLGIDPADLTIHLHPDLIIGEYAALNNTALSLSPPDRPSEQALRLRWATFQEKASRPRRETLVPENRS